MDKELSDQTTAPRLEGLIASGRSDATIDAAIIEAFSESKLYALGSLPGEPGEVKEGASLLHFSIDDKTMIPVYTRLGLLRPSLEKNPDWQALAVLQIQGGNLLESPDVEADIVINPWTDLEFHLTASEE